MTLVRCTKEPLRNIMYAMVKGFNGQKIENLQPLASVAPNIEAGALFRCEIFQYQSCKPRAAVISQTEPTQVQEILPSKPCWPVITPNVVNDMTGSWIRVIEYGFKEITFPTRAVLSVGL